MIIACDVDGVVVNPYLRWVEEWNRDHPENLRKMTQVYQTDTTNPLDLEFLNRLTSGDRYVGLAPMDGARQGIRELMEMGHRVVYVTSCVKNMADAKWHWLEEHGFLPKTTLQAHDLILAHDKYLVAADLLIDDRFEAVADWVDKRGKRAILFDQPWNNGPAQMAHNNFWMKVDVATSWRHLVNQFVRLYGD